MSAVERWSYENLGQWFYVIGYTLVLISHNWPLLLSLGLCLWWGVSLYQDPTRSRVCWFMGSLLLGLTYEYDKHVAPTLQHSLEMVFRADILWLRGPILTLVGPGVRLLLFALMAFVLLHGLWLEAKGIFSSSHVSRSGKDEVI
jgi:hypothetical protein